MEQSLLQPQDNQSIADEVWTQVITSNPVSVWREIQDVWHYRDLIKALIKRDFVSNFKQTILGPAWFVIQPLISTLVFTIIFGEISQLSTDGSPKFLFYMVGNITWNLFSSILLSTAATFRENAALFSKIYFPRLVVPISGVFSKLLVFGIQFSIFLVLLVYNFFVFHNTHFRLTILLFPLLIFLVCVLGLGAGLMLSVMTAKYRDLVPLLGFIIQLLMYFSTVLFPISQLSSKYSWVIIANPISSIIETLRYSFIGNGLVLTTHLAYSTFMTLVIFGVGFYLFTRVEGSVVDVA